MKLRDLFAKPVDRSIEGVIKADDNSGLLNEVEEYVVTHEIATRLEDFFEYYINPDKVNGAWISGFFGSGKSHLLKMLSMLLQNQIVDGKNTLDIFLEKCHDNPMLKGRLQKACSIPSVSILFNIDQKADVISKTEIDALLSVFLKVFDEHCGYYGKQPHIAQFERDLDRDGLLPAFKEAFLKKTGKDWEWGRPRLKRIEEDVDAVYNQITGKSESGLLHKYRNDYRLSIEDFADHINDYLDKKPKNFRLNFFVDEVGQYIADNVKLMTNLQTIAESLATRCKGRAWLLVTSQEDMNTVVGEASKQQSNDFSKIQGRFKARLKLSGQNVDEVIQRRLLAKNAAGKAIVADLYKKHANNFKTLFDLVDGARTYRNFRDEEDFCNCYPFVPYQFSLFQSCIQQLSDHNAFEGKYASVGERSMLGVFQEVAVKIADTEPGCLATYDAMFAGISKVIKSKIQSAIIHADQHLPDPFAVRLLKVLFLVKYVKEFKATVRNLGVLMLDRFDADIAALHTRISRTLETLYDQNYLQKNGDLYEYLTDEEKDIQTEIRNTDIENQEIIRELSKVAFDDVLKLSKIDYPITKTSYTFTRRIDDENCSSEHDMAINIITPFHPQNPTEAAVSLARSSCNEITIFLEPSRELYTELTMLKKTERYLALNSGHESETLKFRIMQENALRNQERKTIIRELLQDLLTRAAIYAGGHKLNPGSNEPAARVKNAFFELISITYPNLKMLNGVIYQEKDIETYLEADKMILPGTTTYTEAENEILAYVQISRNSASSQSIKALIDHFEKKPFGWPMTATLCNLAKLVARGRIEVTSGAKPVDIAFLKKNIRNTKIQASLLLEPQVEFPASEVRRLKDFFNHFFGSFAASTEAKALGEEMAKAFADHADQINAYALDAVKYPFGKALQTHYGRISKYGRQKYDFFFRNFSEEEQNELLDVKEGAIDPIIKFLNGSQKSIYDEAVGFIALIASNLAELNGDHVAEIKRILELEKCYQGNNMNQLRQALDSLKTQNQQRVQREIDNALEAMRHKREVLEKTAEYTALKPEQQAEIKKISAQVEEEIKTMSLLPNIRDRLQRFESKDYARILEKLNTFTEQNRGPAKVTDIPSNGNFGVETGSEPQTTTKAEKTGAKTPAAKPAPAPEVAKPVFIAISALKVNAGKPWLESATDVSEYLKKLEAAMQQAIASGQKIQL